MYFILLMSVYNIQICRAYCHFGDKQFIINIFVRTSFPKLNVIHPFLSFNFVTSMMLHFFNVGNQNNFAFSHTVAGGELMCRRKPIYRYRVDTADATSLAYNATPVPARWTRPISNYLTPSCGVTQI